MNLYSIKTKWKLLLLISAFAIAIGSLWYTNKLVKELTKEESKKIQLWAKATDMISNADVSGESLEFFLEVIRNNETVPVLVVDDENHIVMHRNFDSIKSLDTTYLRTRLEKIKNTSRRQNIFTVKEKNKLFVYVFTGIKDDMVIEHKEDSLKKHMEDSLEIEKINKKIAQVIRRYNFFRGSNKLKVDTVFFRNPISIRLLENRMQFIYYDKSYILKKLTYYPYIQLGIILIFILVAYFAFSYSRKAEQNKVWVGLSKETAHQLGTPLSSMLAWVDNLKLKMPGESMTKELEKDVLRLEKITERFSKIGARPVKRNEDIQEVISDTIAYLKSRTSTRVVFSFNVPPKPVKGMINKVLFEWVLENISKNAIDAIEGNGVITYSLSESSRFVTIDISDTGKGISKSKYKAIFKPGYTTKDRGWGLGLSLTKRIVEEYHKGKIFVASSVIGKGTTIRIVLPR